MHFVRNDRTLKFLGDCPELLMTKMPSIIMTTFPGDNDNGEQKKYAIKDVKELCRC